MRIKFDGRELVVKKTTRAIAAFQRVTGWRLDKMSQDDVAIYGPAMTAFWALTNAGIVTEHNAAEQWDALLDRDLEEFEVIQDPGDVREAEPAPDPQTLPAVSGPVSVAGAERTTEGLSV